jgi:hypothetical protein
MVNTGTQNPYIWCAQQASYCVNEEYDGGQDWGTILWWSNVQALSLKLWTLFERSVLYKYFCQIMNLIVMKSLWSLLPACHVSHKMIALPLWYLMCRNLI